MMNLPEWLRVGHTRPSRAPRTRERHRSYWGIGIRLGADYLGAHMQQILDVRNPSCRMPNPGYLNGTSAAIDSVDDPAWLANYFPDSWISELRHNAPGLWEIGQSLDCLE